MSKPKIGDILVASWGYDATWQDFYEVVAVTPSQVKVRELKKEYVKTVIYDRTTVRPLVGQYTNDEVLTRKFKDYGNGEYYIKPRAYALAVSGRYVRGVEFVESIYA
jgi:hypothetical protein